MGNHFLHFAHGGERIASHDIIQAPMFFCHHLFNLIVGELILFCWLITFTHWLMSLPTSITSGSFSWGGCNTSKLRRKDLIVIITQRIGLSLLPYKFLGVFTSKSTTFFIDVWTWHGQQKGIGNLLLSLLCSFYKQRVLMAL
jgi:hypothetical protein